MSIYNTYYMYIYNTYYMCFYNTYYLHSYYSISFVFTIILYRIYQIINNTKVNKKLLNNKLTRIVHIISIYITMHVDITITFYKLIKRKIYKDITVYISYVGGCSEEKVLNFLSISNLDLLEF